MMFTGIIESVGDIVEVRSRGNYKLLTVRPEVPFDGLATGDSVSVDGCCLTVTAVGKDGFTAEASQETISLSIVGSYRAGVRVNLEQALRASGRLGGHFVTGHVDCPGKIVKIKRVGDSIEWSVKFPAEFSNYIVEKGSIAINGISLTINRIEGDVFSVNLIPYTRRMTTAERQEEGAEVNLEFDLLGKYIIRLLDKGKKSTLTYDKLIESGW
jgi:riboflavin synthase